MLSRASSEQSSRGRGRRRLLLLTALMVVLAGCGRGTPQSTFIAKGKNSRLILHLIVPVLGIAGVVFVLVFGALLYIVVKFRAKDEADFNDVPKQIHGNFKAEIAWTIVPLLILVGVAIPTVQDVFKLATPAKNALHVEVIGQQWWWEYRYDINNDGKFDEVVTANDLVIPAGKPVVLTVESRDVIHSFWVPQLNGKRDAVPNHPTPWNLEADKPGEYIGECAEFCGLSHAEMRIKVVAETPTQFAAWVANQEKPAKNYALSDTSQVAQGYRVFNAQMCSSCHLINGVNNNKVVKGKRAFVQGAPSGTISSLSLQVSQHAPQLTHLMTRTMFAGGKFNLRLPTPYCISLGETWATIPANEEKCLNKPDLEAWIRDAPARKAMMPAYKVDGKTYQRGMPDLDMSQDQIDQLVAYLSTLK